jgi:hypothetical protein
MESMDAVQSHQPLVFDHMIAATSAPPSSMPGKPPFLGVDQRHFEYQIWVWEDAREVHELFEQAEDIASLRAQTPTDDSPTPRILFDELFADDDRFDHHHAVIGQQVPHFVANRR